LGYSRDGVSIRIEPKWGDIFSDDYGGAGGAPADTQLLGAVCLVTAEMPKYDRDEVNKLTGFNKAGTVGTLPQLGTLIRQESEYATLLLDGKNEDFTFTIAFMRQAQEVNKGTKFSTFVVGWECWISDTTARLLFTYAHV
jgi:hypothetical protein